MEIKRATLDQVREGRNGRKITVCGDVFDVVKQIQALDPSLHVYWNEDGEFYAITETYIDECGHHREDLVTAIPPDGLNSALVDHLRYLASSSNDFIAGVERMDVEQKKAHDWELEQETGEIGERMAYIIRKDDAEVNSKAFIPRDIDMRGHAA